MGDFFHEIKSLSDQEERRRRKKKEDKRRDLKVRDKTLTPSFLVFGFEEKPQLCVKCS